MALSENVKISSQVYKKLSEVAKNREVSVSTLVNEAITEWLKKHNKENQ